MTIGLLIWKYELEIQTFPEVWRTQKYAIMSSASKQEVQMCHQKLSIAQLQFRDNLLLSKNMIGQMLAQKN